MCTSLLQVATKYEVIALKNICCTILINAISGANAVDLLKIADDYNVTPLRDAALRFISSNPETFFAERDSDAFDAPDKLIDVVFAAVTGNRQSKRHRCK